MSGLNPAPAHWHAEQVGYIGRIPVRNLWLLMLYASNLMRTLGGRSVAIEETPDDIPDLVAEFLAATVEKRLRRNLTFGYQKREAVLSRVRGRINLLQTERKQLLQRGKVACSFEELTCDTMRNRLVRSALERISQVVRSSDLARRCRKLAGSLRALGVVGEAPTRTQISLERFGRHDAHDQQMVAAAQLALDIALPTEFAGAKPLAMPDREEKWVRKLYEKAVAGFYGHVLAAHGWRTEAGKAIFWPATFRSPGMAAILPQMKTDIILEHPERARRIIIDTKFTEILSAGRFGGKTLTSGYIYQIYAYLRSQERLSEPLAAHAEGLLLHPSVGQMADEAAVIQEHLIRFATVDLSAEPAAIRAQLLRVIDTRFLEAAP